LQLDRRQVLIAGLGALAAAAVRVGADTGVGESWRDADPYAPWRDWSGAPGERARAPVRAAILAANAHNTQPWKFCVHPDRIELYADESRNLGAMDPFRREMRISLGCALENLCLRARAAGYATRLRIESAALSLPAPASKTRRVASVALARGAAAASPLYAAIPARHTSRGPYDGDRPVPPEMLARLAALGAEEPGVKLLLLTDPAARSEFAAATVAATEAIIADEEMIDDSDAWFRGSDAAIAAHRDGPTIAAAGLSPFVTLMARILPAPSPARAHRIWLGQTRDVQLATAAAFGLIAVENLYDQERAMRVGMLWQRLHLMATALGLAAQPLNQLPERVDREGQMGLPSSTQKVLVSLAGGSRWRPTFAFRLGFSLRGATPSPRRDLEAVILAAGCA
jgi:hypothetical protein